MQDPSQPEIVSTLPKPWETEETFNDVLYDWMSRAPWLLISGSMHFVLFLIVAAIPWSVFEKSPEQTFTAHQEPAPEPIVEEEPEPEPEVEPEVVEDTPVIDDFDVVDVSDVQDDVDSEVSEGEPSEFPESPFQANDSTNPVLGLGGGGGSKMGGRFGPGKGRGKGRGGSSEVSAGLAWLAAHQDGDGRWDSDGFMKHDPASDVTDGAGDPNHDIGMTGLAVLAFLGDGHTMKRGQYKDVVSRGIKFLSDNQDRETGLFGEAVGHSYIYDHAIATIAMCEAYHLDQSVLLKRKAQTAINYVSRHRQPYGVWGYQPPPSGQIDTSVTGWMVFAMKAAEDSGLVIDGEAYGHSLLWFDEMTDPGTGRVGYVEAGSPSSRVAGINEHFPTDQGEALTSVALLCRFFLGQTPEKNPVMEDHAELLLRSLPKWNPEGGSCDMYYWYYGSYAMFQMGGKYWKQWNGAMKSAVIDSMRKDGSAKGSWDPVGPWGVQGGRVYATASMVLCMEVYYRYARITGTR